VVTEYTKLEAETRETIDKKLELAGWVIQDKQRLNLYESLGVAVREMDTVARIGGDEFAVILEGVPTRGGAAAVADKIASDLREPFAVQGQSVSIGASIGIAMYPGDGADPDALLRFADQAMYRIKRSGVQDRSR